jgi:uncharacterized repeat protein (TIGR03803 family)
MKSQPPKAISTLKLTLTVAFAVALLAAPSTQAENFKVVYTFTGGDDGGHPLAGLVIDVAGNLYGTASSGGNPHCTPAYCGTVFKIDRSGHETTLYSFAGGSDGAVPEAKLLMSGQGVFYGTTYNGGGSSSCSDGCGTVFRISGGKEKVLYRFKGGNDGANPVAGLSVDKSGNLYGTTLNGGVYGYGTVFELIKTQSKYTESVLYSFTGGTDGANPVSGVTVLNSSLFGTASLGGDSTCLNPDDTYGCGTVFRIAPVSDATGRIRWKESTIHSFEMQDDGGVPYAGLTEWLGDLYGAATSGGDGLGGGGTVFELVHSGKKWEFSALYGLPGWPISGTFRNVVLDSSGNIYATTHCDGTYSDGTVYELTANAWTYKLLYTFTGQSDGYYVFSNLAFDEHGSLYGTTSQGGAYNGTVFKVKP